MDQERTLAQGTAEQRNAELHGAEVVVQLADEVTFDQILDAITSLSPLRQHTAFDCGALRTLVDNCARALPAVLAVLDAAQLRRSTARVVRPSIIDFYLRYAGPTLTASVVGFR